MLTAAQMPILRPLPLRPGDPRRVWEVMEIWRYCEYPAIDPMIIRPPFLTDLASIPVIFSNIISPSGYLFLAGFLHDHVYKYQYIWTERTDAEGNARLIKYWMGREQADRLFGEIANISYPEQWLMTKVAKGALAVGGWKAWNDHRKKDDFDLNRRV